jgi:hypothetical protein
MIQQVSPARRITRKGHIHIGRDGWGRLRATSNSFMAIDKPNYSVRKVTLRYMSMEENRQAWSRQCFASQGFCYSFGNHGSLARKTQAGQLEFCEVELMDFRPHCVDQICGDEVYPGYLGPFDHLPSRCARCFICNARVVFDTVSNRHDWRKHLVP